MEGLSKAEKRRLRKERRKREIELEKSERQREKRIKQIKSYSIAALVIIVIIVFLYWRSIPPEDAPVLEVSPDSYNFGTVSQAKGTVSAEMTITNKGLSDLVLDNMDSSCGCTSASIIYKGVEGPRFSMSMHGTNPKNWQQVIPAGETVQLKVYYDPRVHKDLRGPVTRSIFIFSNDPKRDSKEVKISAYQVD